MLLNCCYALLQMKGRVSDIHVRRLGVLSMRGAEVVA